ncbi:FmdB family zinc ribbon protein [Dethiosulfatarculus sandiegensis]|uniref:FmdB family transcriptional regulator n=1 Tax=Dethiosulfatarculus sandiegensis TaxID=1429043 RepID=A0A0D2JR13_9BACT|nr:zinc ribbon domain-containing protein [Dethiosulfatarculus sandiegensis]KIX11925.1 FmdB family transcriptional regulator [Dethiosulfatarculus sandiegensis]
MPIYEYQCEECNEVTEALQKFSDDPLEKCPHCGGHMHKVMSLNAFHLKGSGWYVTDYKGKNSSTNASGDSKGEKASKTETKPKAEKSSD